MNPSQSHSMHLKGWWRKKTMAINFERSHYARGWILIQDNLKKKLQNIAEDWSKMTERWPKKTPGDCPTHSKDPWIPLPKTKRKRKIMRNHISTPWEHCFQHFWQFHPLLCTLFGIQCSFLCCFVLCCFFHSFCHVWFCFVLFFAAIVHFFFRILFIKKIVFVSLAAVAYFGDKKSCGQTCLENKNCTFNPWAKDVMRK